MYARVYVSMCHNFCMYCIPPNTLNTIHICGLQHYTKQNLQPDKLGTPGTNDKLSML